MVNRAGLVGVNRLVALGAPPFGDFRITPFFERPRRENKILLLGKFRLETLQNIIDVFPLDQFVDGAIFDGDFRKLGDRRRFLVAANMRAENPA